MANTKCRGCRKRDRLIRQRNEIISSWERKLLMLAKLAAKKPLFDNPLEYWAAEGVRDEILRRHGLLKDGERS